MRTTFFLICIIFILSNTGCDNPITNLFYRNSDPDIIYNDNDEAPFFIFNLECLNKKDLLKINPTDTRVLLTNPQNKIIFEGYLDERGFSKYRFTISDTIIEGFYCVTANIKDEKYGNISYYGKLVFYYSGINSLKKKVSVYSVE